MNMKRMRGRNNRGGGQGGGGGGGGGGAIRHHSSGGGIPMNRNHVFDSNGPDLRIRGTAQQLFEKYLQLGRDASGSGDRVMAESYFQHAEHYFRILNAMQQAQQQQVQHQGGQPNGGYQNNGYQQQRRPDGSQGDGGQGDGGQGEGGQGDVDGDMEEELEQHLNGSTEQPLLETRDIPITNAPPEG